MATGYVALPLTGGVIPDGSGSGNAAAAPALDVSGAGQTANSPKVTQFCWDFTSAEQHIMWSFILPGDYASGGAVRLTWKMLTANAGNVVLKSAMAVNVTGTTDDDAIIFNAVALSATETVPNPQGLTKTTTITLTTTNAAANRKVTIMVGSEATNWTAPGFLRLMAAAFEYTKF